MKLNLSTSSIELSTVEAKEAFTFGTDAYKNLQAARHDYPGFKVVTIKPKRNHNDFSELTLKSISAYVEKKGTEEQKEHFAFISKRHIDDDGAYCEPLPFFQIKSWFLATFPEIKQERENARKAFVLGIFKEFNNSS